MTDVRDPATGLADDERLVSAASLEIVQADELMSRFSAFAAVWRTRLAEYEHGERPVPNIS